MSSQPTWTAPITAITLFVGDLAAAKAFYAEVFELPVHYQDEASCVFDFGNTLVNLLVATEARRAHRARGRRRRRGGRPDAADHHRR